MIKLPRTVLKRVPLTVTRSELIQIVVNVNFILRLGIASKLDFILETMTRCVLPPSLNLEFKRGYSNSSNAWKAPEYPVLNVENLSRINDLTFSLGRDTTHEEVHKLLIDAGCFKQGELNQYVNPDMQKN